MELRLVSLGDPLVGPLLADLGAEYHARYGEDGEMSQATPDEFEPPAGAFYVLVEQGRAISGGGLRRLDDVACELKRMWTHAHHRGRGLASSVLAALEGEATRLGYSVVRLETGPRQPEAVALYEKNGYHRIERFGRYPQSVAFEKSLATPAR